MEDRVGLKLRRLSVNIYWPLSQGWVEERWSVLTYHVNKNSPGQSGELTRCRPTHLFATEPGLPVGCLEVLLDLVLVVTPDV